MNNDHVPADEVKKDIADTLSEIKVMEHEVKNYRLLGDPLSVIKADAQAQGIKRSRDFIAQLEKLLKYQGRYNDEEELETSIIITLREFSEKNRHEWSTGAQRHLVKGIIKRVRDNPIPVAKT